MKTLFITPSATAGGGQRWNEIMITAFAKRGIHPYVIFSRFGTPGNIFYHRLQEFVVKDLCFKRNNVKFPQDVATFIDDNDIDYIFVEVDERLREIFENSRRLQQGKARIIMVCHTMDCPLDINIIPNKDIVYKFISVSNKIANRLKQANVETLTIQNSVPAPPMAGINIRSLCGIPNDAFVIGYIGRIDINKGIDTILETCIKHDLWCIIAGQGPHVSTLLQIAQKHSKIKIMPVEIGFPGDWYRAMNVFILPSKMEGFPLSPMEALLCNTSVSMTPTSDYPEIFGKAVRFFPHNNADALYASIQQPIPASLGQEMLLHSHTVDAMVDKYIACLK